MRFVRFVCLFAVLISILVVAQSSPTPAVNQTNGLPIAQPRHPALPPNLSQMPQGAPFVQHGAGPFRTTEPRRGSSSSGLNFAPAVAYRSGGINAQSVQVADVNGDGKPDIVLANWCVIGNVCVNGTVGVLLGKGDGTFQSAVTYSSGGNNANSVAVADVNGDGKLDILVANVNSGTVGVLLGNGDGTFQTAITYGSGGEFVISVAVADINGDGKPDLVVAARADIGPSQ